MATAKPLPKSEATRGGPGQGPRFPPQKGPQQPPAIQGKTGDEVENAQDQVDPGQVTHHYGDEGGAEIFQERAYPPEKRGQNKAGQRADDGNFKLGLGVAGLLGQAGNATENKQGDLRDVDAVVDGHQGVGDLVDHHRREEQQGGDKARYPVGLGSLSRKGPGHVPGRQGKKYQGENDKPGKVQADADTENLEEGDAAPAFLLPAVGAHGSASLCSITEALSFRNSGRLRASSPKR